MKRLSRLVTSRGGISPGAGFQRVSPGVYRQATPQHQAVPRPAAQPMPQQSPWGGVMQPQQQLPTPPPNQGWIQDFNGGWSNPSALAAQQQKYFGSGYNAVQRPTFGSYGNILPQLTSPNIQAPPAPWQQVAPQQGGGMGMNQQQMAQQGAEMGLQNAQPQGQQWIKG